jgi:hypothetical protein
MRLSPACLVLLLSLTSFAASWRGGDPPYNEQGTSDSSYNTYPYSQSQDGYRGNVPPRINTGYSNTGERPVTDSGNTYQSQRPASQFNYEESDHKYGNARYESLQCTKEIYVTSNQIIDIQNSVQYGAQLLDGIYAHSFDVCVDSCCQYRGCDLALYKTDGLSQTGKSCYFVHCGLLDHCRMVSNNGFRAGFLVEHNYEEVLDNQGVPTQQFKEVTPAIPTKPVSTEPPTTQEPVTSATTAMSSETTPTEAPLPVTQETTSFETESETTERPNSMSTTSSPHSTPDNTELPQTVPTTHPPSSSSSSPSHHSTPSHTNLTTSSPAKPTTASTEHHSSATTELAVVDNVKSGNDDGDKIEEEEEDDCSENGCNGGGIVAMTIVGTLMIIVLLVVAAVVTRRIYKIKTRKQYRNVDYLINGMYT